MSVVLLTFAFLTFIVGSFAVEDNDPARPNIVFLVVESTDGRTWSRDYQDGAVDLPNLRALQDKGVEFQSHYSNAPVCCPSRATFWSGRHASNIPHDQKSSGIFVGGAWNNYEGLPPNFTNRMDQVMEQEGYNVEVSGKRDWTTGGHSENVYLNAWTMYTRFPYNLSEGTGGWTDEEGCTDEGGVKAGGSSGAEGSAHGDDWNTLKKTVSWIKKNASVDKRPFFVYQGMTIVHPPYRTSQYWYNKVDQKKIMVPEWGDLDTMHPCDFQSSMLKGCLPPTATAGDFYTPEHRVHIRTIYLAMVAEFDAMVGEYVKAVEDAGKFGNTVFIVTSDHGDMQMEKRQFYKMVPYDASARVPMVIVDGRKPRTTGKIATAVTQLIDIYPTVLTYAGVPQTRWPKLDGTPMQSILEDEGQSKLQGADRPDFVVSQFHGDNIAMSWFLVVQDHFKLIVWGTGQEHPHLLFNLTADPNEATNLVDRPEHAARLKTLLAKLQSVVDYPTVAQNVAKYGHDSMKWWVKKNKNWQSEMGKSGLRWHDSWNQNAEGSVAAVEQWLAKPPKVEVCRSELVWPPAAVELIV
jgi:arylsulfatase A-like enzyme